MIVVDTDHRTQLRVINPSSVSGLSSHHLSYLFPPQPHTVTPPTPHSTTMHISIPTMMIILTLACQNHAVPILYPRHRTFTRTPTPTPTPSPSSILTTFGPHATVATYHISPDGTDSGSCGYPSSPCRSITYAFNISRTLSPRPSSLSLLLSPSLHSAPHNCGWNPDRTQLKGLYHLSLSGPSPSSKATIQCNSSPFFAVFSNPLESEFQLIITLANLVVSGAGSSGGSGSTNANVAGITLHWPSVLRASDVTLVGNRGRVSGGMWISSSASSHSLTNVSFVGNSVDEAHSLHWERKGAQLVSGGGGLRIEADLDQPTWTVGGIHVGGEQLVFDGNSAGYGGGLGVLGTNVQFGCHACVWTNNVAAFGGGVYTESFSSHSLSEGQVANNTAVLGGGLAIMGGDGTMEKMEVTGNQASFYGGGLFVGYVDGVNVSDSIVEDNTATLRGGGVFGVYTRSLFVFTSTMKGNVVTTPDAPGIDTRGSAAYLSHVSGAAAFPNSLLASDDSPLYCDPNTGDHACIPCFASTCDVCYAHTTGCVTTTSGGSGPVLCPTLSPGHFDNNAITGQPGSLQVCTCADTQSKCSGNGMCWWDYVDLGYCKCFAHFTGQECSVPRTLVLGFLLALVGIICSGICFMLALHLHTKRSHRRLLRAAASSSSRTSTGGLVTPLING